MNLASILILIAILALAAVALVVRFRHRHRCATTACDACTAACPLKRNANHSSDK